MTTDRTPGKYERLCWQRHARDLALAARPGGHPKGLHFDEAAGLRVVAFLEGYCRHHKGEWAGKPLTLERWQRDLVVQAFGWKRRDGTRRFRTLYWEVPRKNGKSEIAGGIGLYLMVADQEQGAEVYSSATMRDQARIVWSTAAAMVKASAELKRFVKVMRNNINCERMGSKFEPLSADSKTLDGLNPHGNVVDELHAHADRGVWDVLDTAMGARRQPLTLAITTAGTYDPKTIGWQMHHYATQVLEGVFEDDAFHAVIFAADDSGDHDYIFSEAAHRQANPNWGVSVKPEYLAQQAEKARRQPGFLNEYKRLHLNVWTQTLTRWLSLEDWAACEPPAPALPGELFAVELERERRLEGRPCFGGLDLSTKLDLSTMVLVFERPDAPAHLDVLCRFWLPEATVEKYSRRALQQFAQWQREGWLVATPGDVVDYEFIRAEANALAKRYQLRELAFDPWGATDLATRLMGDGLQMVEVRQGFKSLSEPSKDLEARVAAKQIHHGHNPILRYCASNAVVQRDAAGNIKPDKHKDLAHIDGIVGLVMAMSRLISQKASPTNPYESRGLLSV